ncbi:MAG: T9SS type A sorting domain-containing protein, partial [Chryseobacterium sp.]
GEVSKIRKINLNTGNLDLSYGENGYAQIRYSNSSNFNFYSGSVVVDDQNNIFVNKFDDLEGNCQLTKTNSLGNLDSAFGTNGVIEFDNSFTYNGEDYLGGERRPLLCENMILVSSEFETAGVGKIGIRGFYTSGNPVMINNDYFYPLSDVTYTHPEYLRMIVKDNYLYVFFDNKIARYIFAQSTLATNAISQNGNSLNLNNPFKDELNLNTNEKIKSVEIYEETGRSVLKANATKNINTSMLKKGIYFIKIITDQNQIISKKGIKN